MTSALKTKILARLAEFPDTTVVACEAEGDFVYASVCTLRTLHALVRLGIAQYDLRVLRVIQISTNYQIWPIQ